MPPLNNSTALSTGMEFKSAGLEFKNAPAAPAAVESKGVADLMTAFEEFKTANDNRLKTLEEKGKVDPLEEEKLTKLNTFMDKFEGQSEKLVKMETELKASADLAERFDALETALKRKTGGDPAEKKQRNEEWLRAVYHANTTGTANLTDEQKSVLDEVAAEFKALNVGTATDGGYLAPIEFVREIDKGITEISPARQIVRVRSTANKAVQIPKRTGQFAATRVHEQGTKAETTGLTYGMEELTAPEMYALVDITNDMMEDSAFNMEAEINAEAIEQFAVKEGAEFVSGTGVGELEGILTNADVSYTAGGETATLTNGDALITLKGAVKTGYSRNGLFIMNRTTIAAVRKLKDGAGNYLWVPGLASSAPNTIDGENYLEFPDMPNVGAGLYPIAFGDFRRAYTMLDRTAIDVLRDPYTQATTGKVRFIVRKRVGGKIVLAEAIRKLKIATS